MDIEKIGFDYKEIVEHLDKTFTCKFEEFSAESEKNNQNDGSLIGDLINDQLHALMIAFAKTLEANNNQIKKDIENLK